MNVKALEVALIIVGLAVAISMLMCVFVGRQSEEGRRRPLCIEIELTVGKRTWKRAWQR